MLTLWNGDRPDLRAQSVSIWQVGNESKNSKNIDIISCFTFKLNSSNQSIQTIFELYILFFHFLDFKGTVTLKWTFIPQNISGASQQNDIAAFSVTTENNH